MAELTFTNVEKVYPGGIRALGDFSLEIADGRLVVLLGPSGCGKTTTLRMAAGLEDVTSGAISIAGTVVNHVPPKDRNVAMVFQECALYPQMTVRQNMAFGLRLRKVPGPQRQTRVRRAAEVLGLAALLDRRPRTLSGGERQRVALGRAIVRRPDVFLFDEPLSNLDAALRSRMRVEIKRLHARLHATMLYVTHDQVEAMTLGETIVVLRDGLIQQAADPIGLYDSPANRFVAGFVGTPPMNLFEGRVARQGDELAFAAESGFVLPLPDEALGKLTAPAERPVTLGIRPEHLRLTRCPSSSGAPRIEARVEVVEPMGAESHVHLSVGGERFVVRTDLHESVQPGESVLVEVLADKVHFFDPASGASLTKPRPVVQE